MDSLDLLFQKWFVQMEILKGGCQHSHRLHPGSSLQLAMTEKKFLIASKTIQVSVFEVSAMRCLCYESSIVYQVKNICYRISEYLWQGLHKIVLKFMRSTGKTFEFNAVQIEVAGVNPLNDVALGVKKS